MRQVVIKEMRTLFANKRYFWLTWSIFAGLLGETAVLAHGANIQYRSTEAISIQATYDDGTPMDKAQVVVYAPNDLVTPWLTGVTNEEGYFSFVPDSDLSGNWDVKVRQSGHGDIISIPLTEGKLSANANGDIPSSGDSNYSPMQKIVMAAAGLWGFIGTALFFSRKQSYKR